MLAATAGLLAISIAGVVAARILPSEVRQETTVLGYQHNGGFDYVVRLKPSYLFGPAPADARKLKYPAAVVQTIDFSYGYTPAKESPGVAWIDAVLENPGLWKKKVSLVPETATSGTFNARFPLDIGQTNSIFDAVEKEIGIVGSPRSVTISAQVDSAGERFIHNLPIKLDRSLIELDSGSLTQARNASVGRFDYQVNSMTKVAEPLPSPRYPVEIVDTMDLVFSYVGPPNIPGEARIDAVLENPGVWQKNISLVPATRATSGSATYYFSLDLAGVLDQFIQIEKETRIAGVPRRVTINAVVDDGGRPFVQSLPMTIDKGFIEVAGKLSSEESGWAGKFDYSLSLKPNSIFEGKAVLRPPSAPPPVSLPPSYDLATTGSTSPATLTPAATVGPGGVIFTRLADRMDVTFSYQLKSDRPVDSVTTDAAIFAVISVPNLWTRNFPLLQTRKAGDFNVTFPVDLASYVDLLDAIHTETGGAPESYDVSITANLRTVASSPSGKIDEIFMPAMKGTIRGNVLDWDRTLTASQPGAIKQTKVIANPNMYMGLSLDGARTASSALAGLFLFLCLGSVVLYVLTRPPKPSLAEKEAARLKKKYAGRIVEALGHAPPAGDKTVSLSSVEDLMRVADELGKPVIHQGLISSDERHVYCVIDGTTRYEYQPVSGNAGD